MNERIYYNGTIVTLEEKLYTPAIMFRDDKIAKLGTLQELKSQASSNTEFIDLKGKTLMPSFIDAHGHFSGYASSLLQVSLEESISFEEIAQSLKDFIMKNNIPTGAWVVARGYDHNQLQEKRHPSKTLLDEACPHNPCVIQHKSGHMGVFNSLALKELNITMDTPSEEGGLIEKSQGSLTGYLEESAFVNYIKMVPMSDINDLMNAFMKSQNIYASYGITTIQEGFVIKELIPLLCYLKDQQLMNLDLVGYLDINAADELKPMVSDCLMRYHNHIKIGGYKTFLDGSPQGRTAWMLTPYLENGEDSNYYGYPNYKDEDLEKRIEIALIDHMQLLCHCNGDAACAQYIHEYKRAQDRTGIKDDLRPVMIHAQLLNKEQLEDVKHLHMIPSFFVAHVYYWGDIHIKNFGLERTSSISCANSTQKKGIRFTFHQDAPVIEPNMLETIWCSVNRITKKGIELGKEEELTVLNAIKAVTINAAYQYFEEDQKGSLHEGKCADYIILSDNPLTVPKDKIREIQILATYKDGQEVFSANKQ